MLCAWELDRRLIRILEGRGRDGLDGRVRPAPTFVDTLISTRCGVCGVRCRNERCFSVESNAVALASAHQLAGNVWTVHAR